MITSSAERSLCVRLCTRRLNLSSHIFLPIAAACLLTARNYSLLCSASVLAQDDGGGRKYFIFDVDAFCAKIALDNRIGLYSLEGTRRQLLNPLIRVDF
jgi:hypothetical protein